MRSYSEVHVFSETELRAFRRAQELVNLVPDIEGLRCHELARAVGQILELPVQDGKYGMVQHSWLWTKTWKYGTFPPSIIDVYAVGSIPQVQLINVSSMGVPHLEKYSPGDIRIDIDQNRVKELCAYMTDV